uniref:NADH-ubiquinone oxidoreductase chain 4L n=1 Tax=Byturus ochraceus TaxID=153018 RepID=A0A343A3Q6_9CUCU|nr:NADH dehydrogenase subunit 4L [Byturus ochraceus]AOY39184.1 NADH dehydrogenase subunit 4L [Byturus ochraceus]
MFIYLMFFSGVLVFCFKRKHLLLMLLSLEYIVLSLFLGLMFYLNFMNYEYYFSMIYISVSICEGVLGLSLLVLMIRMYGNDYFQTFNLLW